jgi:hypothetical protein
LAKLALFVKVFRAQNLRIKIVVIARRFLPKQSLDFQRIASLACGTAWRGGRQGRLPE